MVKINDKIHIDDDEIDYIHLRSSGPGGQNVNKVSTGVQLRFNVRESISLASDVKTRIMKFAGNRISREGVLTINSTTHRTQHQNMQEALRKFRELVREAARIPKKRVSTKVPKSSKRKRLKEKKKRAEIKKLRNEDFC